MNYDEFIEQKSRKAMAYGFEPYEITAPLFDWQKHVASWAVRKGRSALFEECGLGKTLQQLEWASQIARHTGKPVIVLTPLSVANQTQREAVKFGYTAKVVAEESEIDGPGIYITNYDKLDHFENVDFGGVVLDESSILKNFKGSTRIALTKRFETTQFRLCCTATPSPNDYTEFGQHADFLGICSPSQMLATYFINDTFNTGDWRLKKHAENVFWEWVSSWAACISKPSDIGFDDDGYNLPALNLNTIIVDVDEVSGRKEGELIRFADLSATTMHQELRMTAQDRVNAVADLANNSDESWLVWCNTNTESEMLTKAIPDAVEVRGSDSSKFKETAIEWFKGNLCSCHNNKLRSKFPACPSQNILKNTTNETETQNWQHPRIGKKTTPNTVSNTCKSIMPSANQNGIKSEHLSNEIKLTQGEESNIRVTQYCSKRPEMLLENGSKKIQKSAESKSLKYMVLPEIATTQCCQTKVEHVQSADQKPSLLLTTAIQQEMSEDCYARDAILGLESLKTTEDHSLGHQCICGMQGKRRILVSKSSIFGYGLNFQHCRNVAFVGLSYSFEDFYQALRRSYRFGQKREVNAFVIHATTEGPIMKTIKRKMKQHEEMQQQMKIAAECFKDSETKRMTMKTEIDKKQNDNWTLYHGDCVRVAREIEDHSIDFSVFSPPFADLFTYSNDLQDMGNCEGLDDFTKHFEILIAEMKRIMVPGREVAVHCVDLLSTKWKTGAIQFQDFSGEIIRAFWRHGFLFHSRICIWKNPVTEMQRTKAHGLLHATLKKDSSDSRVGCADYLLVFKAPGKNPKPITKDATQFPVSWWQEVASPVWMTIDQGNVLNKSGARDHQDEKHICPLQLDVIERAITLWSNPGDLVYSPFTGIGSEGVGALRLGRQFVGSELKESYFQQACGNLNNATAQQEMRLF